VSDDCCAGGQRHSGTTLVATAITAITDMRLRLAVIVYFLSSIFRCYSTTFSTAFKGAPLARQADRLKPRLAMMRRRARRA
jgi:hypothetical protein